MKVNILFTIKEMAARRTYAGPADANLHVRATGRTTGIALAAIGLAMQEGNHCVSFTIPRDHHNTGRVSSQDAVATSMAGLVDQLGLKGFNINMKTMTYNYRVIYEV